MDIPMKLDDLGVSPILGNLHIDVFKGPELFRLEVHPSLSKENIWQ